MNVPLVSGQKSERKQGLTPVMDVEVWRIEGLVGPSNTSARFLLCILTSLVKNGFGAFFKLGSFWLQESRESPDSMWLLFSL